MMRRPSEARPAGWWKKVSPEGEAIGKKAAAMHPVSELESPKLKIAGKSQEAKDFRSSHCTPLVTTRRTTHDTIIPSPIFSILITGLSYHPPTTALANLYTANLDGMAE